MAAVTLAGVGAPTPPPETPPFIYRAGGTNPSNLTANVGKPLSFRDSLSNPWPLEEGARPVFGSGSYIKVDTARLPPGSVVVDNHPPGHVSVSGVSATTLKGAVVEKAKLP